MLTPKIAVGLSNLFKQKLYIELNSYSYYMIQESILITKREAEAINKKLQGKKITQQDSNYLSRYVRPKLKEMMHIDSRALLRKIEYNQKIPAIEKHIKNLILKNIKYVSSITIYGSAIYNNYKDYNDIDVLVTVKKKTWKKTIERALLEKRIRKTSRLKLDVKLYTDEYVYHHYASDITLIYELKDSKTIYGMLNYKKTIYIPILYLKMHSDYSELILDDIRDNGLRYVESRQLYAAIRNLIIIKLIIQKTVDNLKLNQVFEDELGKNIIIKLKNNSKSLTIKNIAYIHLKDIYNNTTKLIDNLKEDIKWGKNKQ